MLWVNLEVSLGLTIDEACRELVKAQRRLGLLIRTKFNDYRIVVGPDTTAKQLVEGYTRYCSGGKNAEL